MKHRFTVTGELDTPLAIAVAAYLDCEHYIFLHNSLTNSLKVLSVEGRTIVVQQAWKAFGLTLGHTKQCEYIPPAEFKITNVTPYPWWVPNFHHFIGLSTHLKYTENPERNTTLMRFDVELDMPFWLYPFRRLFQRLIEKMHAQQNMEDMAMIKRRAQMYGRENASAYLADHHFCYHKDEYMKYFGKKSVEASRSAV